MKTIRLLRLELRDFQGGTFVFEPDGKDSDVFGMNTSGKTRLVSAFTWLLFGKDALGRTDFSIKNLNSEGEPEHNLEHTVEGILEVDGETISLKKVFSEKWTKKRGRAKQEFAGHSADYYVDGVPMKEKDYNARVTEIAGTEENFRLLTSPTVFPSLHWTKQRALLLEVCGDISDSDVIASKTELSKLKDILGKRSIEDHRKVIASRKVEINKELEKVPVRIDECRRSMPDVTGINQAQLEKEKSEIETLIADMKLKLRGVDTGGVIAELTKKLSIINADLQRMEGDHFRNIRKHIQVIDSTIADLSSDISRTEKEIQDISNYAIKEADARKDVEEKISELRTQWYQINAETFTETISGVCPTCGQPFPQDRILGATEKALALFNSNKAERLKEIERKGKALTQERDQHQRDFEDFVKKEKAFKDALPAKKAELEELASERDELKKKSEDYSLITGHTNLVMKRAEVEDQIKEEQQGHSVDTDAIKKQIEYHEGVLNQLKISLNKFTQRANGEKRIETLKAEEKKLAEEFEKLEEELFLCDDFIKTKVSLLTDKINSNFEFTRFKLFDTLINQGIEPCCEIMVNGVGYNSGLNSAARTQAGMDIIRTLQRHYGVHAPVFIDNRESCTEIPKMETQVISLYVSPEDKTLRVEKGG